MRRRRDAIWGISVALALLSVGLLACTPDKSAPTLEPQAIAAANQTGDLAPVSAPVELQAPDIACLNCHTDQERLMELAVPKEDTGEKLSSGPG